MYKGGHLSYPPSLQVVFGSTPKTLFFSKNIMTSPRLPLVKAKRTFLSGIRLSTQFHGHKVKVTAPPIKKTKFGTLGVLDLR